MSHSIVATSSSLDTLGAMTHSRIAIIVYCNEGTQQHAHASTCTTRKT